LLLSAAYDAAFDALLISFNDDGGLILAADFSAEEAAAASIDVNARLTCIPDGLARYLSDHRDLMLARVSRQQVLATPA
jgi:hypothetical protein